MHVQLLVHNIKYKH